MAPQSRRFFDDAGFAGLWDASTRRPASSAASGAYRVQRQAIPTTLSGRNVLVSASGRGAEAACAPLVENSWARDLHLGSSLRRSDAGPGNDICERLRRPLTGLGVQDHPPDRRPQGPNRKEASVIVTTPEFFESMMCSRSQWLKTEPCIPWPWSRSHPG